jgi:hypothetical protein
MEHIGLINERTGHATTVDLVTTNEISVNPTNRVAKPRIYFPAPL